MASDLQKHSGLIEKSINKNKVHVVLLRICVKRNHARTEGLFSAVSMSPIISPTCMSLSKSFMILVGI